MSHPNLKSSERLLDLGNGMAIWRVHHDALREQDRNARTMSREVFDRLTKNIKNDARLESLPFCTPNRKRDGEFEIISGHHRTRAARAAGIETLIILVDERELTRDQIRSKQLAHNSLSGEDDAQVLQELYQEIQDLDEKIASGVALDESEWDVKPVSVPEVSIELDVERLNILFLRRDYKHFEALLKKLEPESQVYVADKADWDRFTNLVGEIRTTFDVRNIGAIMTVMLDLTEEALKARAEKGEEVAA